MPGSQKLLSLDVRCSCTLLLLCQCAAHMVPLASLHENFTNELAKFVSGKVITLSRYFSSNKTVLPKLFCVYCMYCIYSVWGIP